MTVFYNDKKDTQELKKFLKPHTPVKQMNPQEKIGDKIPKDFNARKA